MVEILDVMVDQMAANVEIRPSKETDLESLNDAINSVCHIKWYLAKHAAY